MDRITLRPSQLGAGHYVLAQCLTCREHRYLGPQFMIDHAGDIPIFQMSQRIRCVARPRDKRGPACGGAMELQVNGPIEPDSPTDWRE